MTKILNFVIEPNSCFEVSVGHCGLVSFCITPIELMGNLMIRSII
jgi:hypothetical protein